MFKYSVKSQHLKGLLKDSAKLYIDRFVDAWPILLVIGFFLTVIDLMQWIFFRVIGQNMTVGHWFVFSLFSLVFLLTYLFGIVLTLHRIHRRIIRPDAHFAESLQESKRVFLRVIWASVIVYTLVIMGILFFVLPGIWLAVLVMLALPAIVLDNFGVIESVKRSFHLVWGHWWNAFFTVAIPIAVIAVINYFLYYQAPRSVFVYPVFVLFTVRVIIMPIFTSWVLSSLLVIYHDLKLKEIGE